METSEENAPFKKPSKITIRLSIAIEFRLFFNFQIRQLVPETDTFCTIGNRWHCYPYSHYDWILIPQKSLFCEASLAAPLVIYVKCLARTFADMMNLGASSSEGSFGDSREIASNHAQSLRAPNHTWV